MTKKALEHRKEVTREALQTPWPEDFPVYEQLVYEIRMIEACHYDPEDAALLYAYAREVWAEMGNLGLDKLRIEREGLLGRIAEIDAALGV